MRKHDWGDEERSNLYNELSAKGIDRKKLYGKPTDELFVIRDILRRREV